MSFSIFFSILGKEMLIKCNFTKACAYKDPKQQDEKRSARKRLLQVN